MGTFADDRLTGWTERWPRVAARVERWLGHPSELPTLLRADRDVFLALVARRTPAALVDVRAFAAGRRLPLHDEEEASAPPATASPARSARRAGVPGHRGAPQVARLEVPHPVERVLEIPRGVLLGAGTTWSTYDGRTLRPMEVPEGAQQWGPGGVAWRERQAWRVLPGGVEPFELPEPCDRVCIAEDRVYALGSRFWIRTGETCDAHPRPGGSNGVLLAEGDVVFHVGDDGRVERFGRGRWWDSGRVEGTTRGASVVDGGWCSPHWIQRGTPPFRLEQGEEGVVLPARGATAVLLGRSVHRLFEIAGAWWREGDLEEPCFAAAVLPDGRVIAAGRKGVRELRLAITEIDADLLLKAPEGSRRTFLELVRVSGLALGQVRVPAAGLTSSDPVQLCRLAGLDVMDEAAVRRLAASLGRGPEIRGR